METRGYAEQRRVLPSFLNFLRGMETGVRTGLRGVQRHFLNFLRGMETYCGGSSENQPLDFLNFLRGMETKYVAEAEGGANFLPKLP